MKAISLSLVIVSLLAIDTCRQSVRSQLDSRIPPPDHNKYKSILDGANWENPKLIIEADRIVLTADGAAVRNQMISTDELAAALTSLPVSAWPYGRVIAAQEPGIIGNVTDLPRIRQNREKAARILKSLGLQVNWWPSA